MTSIAALLAAGWLAGASPDRPVLAGHHHPADSPHPNAVRLAGGPTAPTGATPAHSEAEGFLLHLDEAIALNEQRKDYYAARSRGRSLWLSHALIGFERLSRGTAAAIDRRALAFQQRGIPVVSGDFVPMSLAAARSEQPRYRQVAAKEHFRTLQQAIDRYRPKLTAALDQQDLRQASALTYGLLESIDEVEKAAQAHFAMTRHVAESLGLAAVNGLDHAAASNGETLPLSVELVRVQALALLSSLWIDREAQRCHVLGVGIIVNDVPHIPFADRWRRIAAPADPT